jgi:hypothetical protein
MERKDIKLLEQKVQQVIRKVLNRIVFIMAIFANIYVYGNTINNDTTCIEGYIYDSLDDSPLQYAEIFIVDTSYNSTSFMEDTSNKAISDSSGYFRISNISTTDFTLLVRCIGYRTYAKRINRQNNKFLVKVKLTSIFLDMDENLLNIKIDTIGPMLGFPNN